MIGKWRITKAYSVGAFKFVDADCTDCPHGSKRTGAGLREFVNGLTLGCRKCYHDEKRAAIKALNERKKAERAAIRARFKKMKP